MRSGDVGRLGERLAAEYLQKHGVRILARNYAVRGGELDLVGFFRGGLLFVEVKTRSGVDWGTPAEAIDREKLRRVEHAAKAFVRAQIRDGRVPVPGLFGGYRMRRVRYERVDGVEVYLRADGSPSEINRIEDIGYEIRQHTRTD